MPIEDINLKQVLHVFPNDKSVKGDSCPALEETSLRATFHPRVLRYVLNWKAGASRRPHAFLVFNSINDASSAQRYIRCQGAASELGITPLIDASDSKKILDLMTQISSQPTDSNSTNRSNSPAENPQPSHVIDPPDMPTTTTHVKSEVVDQGDLLDIMRERSAVGNGPAAAVASSPTRSHKSITGAQDGSNPAVCKSPRRVKSDYLLRSSVGLEKRGRSLSSDGDQPRNRLRYSSSAQNLTIPIQTSETREFDQLNLSDDEIALMSKTLMNIIGPRMDSFSRQLERERNNDLQIQAAEANYSAWKREATRVSEKAEIARLHRTLQSERERSARLSRRVQQTTLEMKRLRDNCRCEAGRNK